MDNELVDSSGRFVSDPMLAGDSISSRQRIAEAT
jgi:hypothetical protein